MDSRNDRRHVARQVGALRRAALFAFVMLLLPLGSLAADQVRVKGTRVNVRLHPNTTSDVLFQVTKGDTLQVMERTGSWYLVETPEGKRGYIHADFVETIELRTPAAAANSTRAVRQDPADELRDAQERSLSEKRSRTALYKIVGGAAGVVTGIFVMDSSKPVGIGLVGAGGYFLWDGFGDRRHESRQRRWNLGLQVGRDQAGVVYTMSW